MSESPHDDWHITSLVVHALPSALDAVSEGIRAIEGSQIHVVSPTGKMVVTLETLGNARMVECISAVQRLEGVLSAALVYQHADSVEAMNEEILP
ncbi:MAG TPA: chaperone NapD [Rhodocyclaceae bacterium]|nr:chaperone NapD [Rhodocyclaceae bacterium]